MLCSLSVELSCLNKAQREAVAAFVLAFPGGNDSEVVPENNESQEENNEGVITCAIPIFDEETPEQIFPLVMETEVIPPPPAAVEVTATSVDKRGLPWDDRIHASSRAKTADGNWRMKRGVDSALVTTVEGELRAVMAIPAPPAAVERIETTVFPPPPSVTAIPPAPAAPAAASVPSITSSPVASAQSSAIPAPPAAGSHQAFADLIGYASAAMGNGKLSQAEVSAAVNALGVPSIQLLGSRLDLVPMAMASIKLLVEARG